MHDNKNSRRSIIEDGFNKLAAELCIHLLDGRNSKKEFLSMNWIQKLLGVQCGASLVEHPYLFEGAEFSSSDSSESLPHIFGFVSPSSHCILPPSVKLLTCVLFINSDWL